jgi:hypothetical protein
MRSDASESPRWIPTVTAAAARSPAPRPHANGEHADGRRLRDSGHGEVGCPPAACKEARVAEGESHGCEIGVVETERSRNRVAGCVVQRGIRNLITKCKIVTGHGVWTR